MCKFFAGSQQSVSRSPLSLGSNRCTCHSCWWAVNLETASGPEVEGTSVWNVSTGLSQTNTSAFMKLQGLLPTSSVYLAEGIFCVSWCFPILLSLRPRHRLTAFQPTVNESPHRGEWLNPNSLFTLTESCFHALLFNYPEMQSFKGGSYTSRDWFSLSVWGMVQELCVCYVNVPYSFIQTWQDKERAAHRELEGVDMKEEECVVLCHRPERWLCCQPECTVVLEETLMDNIWIAPAS